MHPQASAFLSRVRAQALSGTNLSQMDRWMEQNTSHPKNARLPWSFDHHEFQRDILNCSAPEACVKKVSQVGLSEVSVRLMLGLLTMYSNRQGIFTLPTASFAKNFAKTRFDPVINDSGTLKSQISKDNNSTELKQLGTSFLHLAGTFGQRAAISIPADFLFHDELDFSDADVISSYGSRLGHTLEGEQKIRRQFSTPTVPGFGVDRLYGESSKGLYAVKHDKCGEWVMPRFMEDVIVPGFDADLLSFTRDDLDNKAVKADEAWVRCPACTREITLANLADPSKREWVHEHPELMNTRAGFWVQTLDVPTINPPAKTLNQIRDYRTRRDWINFKVGEVFEDSDNSFVDTVVDNHLGPWLRPRERAAVGCVFGLDVGKTSHLLIGRPEGKKIHIVHAERIRQDGEDHLKAVVRERMLQYGIIKGVVDAAPDFTTAMGLVEAGYSGQVWACQYTRQSPKALTSYKLEPVEQVIKAHRTRTLNEAATMHNAGRVVWPNCPETDEIKNNLGNIKKLGRDDSVGETVEYWVKLGPDHYAHALNYLLLAADMGYGSGASGNVVLSMGVDSVRFSEARLQTSLME